MITGNKGEWSEIYAFFKILADKKLFAGDADLNQIQELFFPIVKIIRTEFGQQFEYELEGDLIVVSGGHQEIRIPISMFIDQASALLTRIKSSSGSFSVEESEIFMASINCRVLKASSSVKTDIRIVIYDPRISQCAELGFSIKSKLGGEATLLNASVPTNFTYEVSGFAPSLEERNTINTIITRSKIKDRIIALNLKGASLKFCAIGNDVFKNNLMLIDGLLPNILAEITYKYFTSNLNTVASLTSNITDSNPLGFNMTYGHAFYKYKIKRFLTDVALGMKPAEVWTGFHDANGGYLIVKENGDVLCYHVYNRNQFEEYLYSNTKLETASSTRHGFGQIYEEGGKYYFKLNLQIRFK